MIEFRLTNQLLEVTAIIVRVEPRRLCLRAATSILYELRVGKNARQIARYQPGPSYTRTSTAGECPAPVRHMRWIRERPSELRLLPAVLRPSLI